MKSSPISNVQPDRPAPSTEEVATVLAKIWRQVLETDEVGMQDDFFQRGGDSLAAAHVAVEIEKTFGRKLGLADLMQAPTVGKMAYLISRQCEPAPLPVLVGLQRGGSRPPFFCVHPVGGAVHCYTELASHLAPEQPC
jgi:acyl carrier protein